jgi:tetratricopeptide (TPR) repeat protein
MAIDLRNRQNLKSTIKEDFNTSIPRSDIDNKLNNLKQSEENKKLNLETNSDELKKSKSIYKYQWLLVGYIVVLLSIISGLFVLDWSNIWQLPKSIAFALGITGFLIIVSILWIFGFIKHSVKINLGDIILTVIGLTIVIISFLNPNQIAFWGSTARIFDSAIFIGFLILFYVLLKLFLESKFIKIISLSFASLILVSEIITVLVIYFSSIASKLSIFSRLLPSNNWLTESPQELGFLSLLVFNIIFMVLSSIDPKYKIHRLLFFIYYISIFIHILILIRLPGYIMYTLTIVTLIINTILHISRLFKNITNNSSSLNKRLIVSRLSFGYGILIIILSALMIIRPFQNNSQFPEYATLTVPNFNTSLSIAKKSLQSDTWFGSSNIMYAWNKFTPPVIETQITDFSFETLYNEVFNLIVKNGLPGTILMIVFAIWFIGSIFRLLLIYKTIPIEIYTILILIIGLFLLPFTAITKILLILGLVIWSNVVSQYFRPILKLNLDINKIPASISSLFTFIILFSIASSVLVSTRFYNIIKSQEYVVKASNVQNNLAEQADLLKRASSQSPYILDYVHLYIPLAIQQLNQDALELLTAQQQQSETQSIDADKQKKLQDKINEIQTIIDQYKKNFPSDTRVIYWQLDLFSVVHTYGNVDENEYLELIKKGKELQPNSLYWDLYEAKYYAIQARKDKELNLEKLNQAKSVLNSILEKNIYFVDAYQTYYDLLSLNQEYKEQIDILNKYINITVEKNLVADQNLVYSLALAYQNDKQYNEALIYYNKLIEAFPEYTNVYFKLGEIYEIEKKFDLAKQNYQKVLELDPNAEPARLKLEQLR